MKLDDRLALTIWRRTDGETRQRARTALMAAVTERAEQLVAKFYNHFLSDPEASAFLSHSVVSERLSHSLRDWLLDLLKVDPDTELTAFNERQRFIGEVHARIRIPIHLVIEGASLLKSGVAEHLSRSPLDRDALVAAIIYLGELIDYAVGMMSQAFVQGSNQRVRADEALRWFSFDQDLSLEREKQRAALMEWSQTVLFAFFARSKGGRLDPIAHSQFGLWLNHRAGVLFPDHAPLDEIRGAMNRIDRDLLPKLMSLETGDPQIAVLLKDLENDIEKMSFLLSELFQTVSSVEQGRDPLTRTLNRRFLPSILAREITIATKSGFPFSLLMIDVDEFKRINDRWGHTTGDTVLRQIADILIGATRLSDFVFRYGGEEFMLLMVETGPNEAFEQAERIRKTIAERAFVLQDGTEFRVTVSVGVAPFDGHPDPDYLVNAADDALYEAKSTGRNRSVLARKGRTSGERVQSHA